MHTCQLDFLSYESLGSYYKDFSLRSEFFSFKFYSWKMIPLVHDVTDSKGACLLFRNSAVIWHSLYAWQCISRSDVPTARSSKRMDWYFNMFMERGFWDILEDRLCMRVRKIVKNDYYFRHICLSVCLSVCMEKLFSQCTDFHEIWH